MTQLIITVLAIALTALTVLASLNYLPWWYQGAADTDHFLRGGMGALERGYKTLARDNAGVPPAVTADTDGGFETNFRPLLRLLPNAPEGYSWSYHQRPMDGSLWEGLNYFCLSAPAGGATIAEWKGVKRATALYSSEQAVVSDVCGASVNAATPTGFPAPFALTFYVTYVPGVDG